LNIPARLSAWAIYNLFETKDEPVFICVVTDALWESFCKLFDAYDLRADESLCGNEQCANARDRMMPKVCALVSEMTRN